MIHSYIRDEALRAKWDVTNPAIRPLHQSIVKGWIETADAVRDAIRAGSDQPKVRANPKYGGAMADWIWENINLLQEADIPINDMEIDLVMDAYLDWGVRNYPITDRITDHTLEALERLYTGDNPEEMMWDEYLHQIDQIVRYQAGRNRKAPEAMTREEMIRHIGTQDEATLRKMLAAVEYRAGR